MIDSRISSNSQNLIFPQIDAISREDKSKLNCYMPVVPVFLDLIRFQTSLNSGAIINRFRTLSLLYECPSEDETEKRERWTMQTITLEQIVFLVTARLITSDKVAINLFESLKTLK